MEYLVEAFQTCLEDTDKYFPDTITMVVSFAWLIVLVVGIPVGITFYGKPSLWVLEAVLILAMISVFSAIVWSYYRVRRTNRPREYRKETMYFSPHNNSGIYSANRMNTLMFALMMGIVACCLLPSVISSLETTVWQTTADDVVCAQTVPVTHSLTANYF